MDPSIDPPIHPSIASEPNNTPPVDRVTTRPYASLAACTRVAQLPQSCRARETLPSQRARERERERERERAEEEEDDDDVGSAL